MEGAVLARGAWDFPHLFAQSSKIFNADFDLILLSAGETATSLAINHLLGKIKSAVLKLLSQAVTSLVLTVPPRSPPS